MPATDPEFEKEVTKALGLIDLDPPAVLPKSLTFSPSPPPGAPSQGFPAGQVPTREAGPVCKKCLSYVDPCAPGVRVAGKSSPTFQCPTCCSKITTLSRLLGRWPIDEFKELSEEEQTEFWQSSGVTVFELQKAVEKHLVRRLINQRLNEVKGAFLPLSVWANKGRGQKPGV